MYTIIQPNTIKLNFKKLTLKKGGKNFRKQLAKRIVHCAINQIFHYSTMAVKTELIHLPYKQLPLSSSLKRAFSLMGCHTLDELLKKKASELLAFKGFGSKNMKELYQFLADHNIEHLLIEC